MSAAEKQSAERARVCPVKLPAAYWTGEPRGTYEVTRAAEQERRGTGYTSMRVSKATMALLRELAAASRPGRRSVGMDELLYFDALERLGRLPESLQPRVRTKPAASK